MHSETSIETDKPLILFVQCLHLLPHLAHTVLLWMPRSSCPAAPRRTLLWKQEVSRGNRESPLVIVSGPVIKINILNQLIKSTNQPINHLIDTQSSLWLCIKGLSYCTLFSPSEKLDSDYTYSSGIITIIYCSMFSSEHHSQVTCKVSFRKYQL